MTPTIHLTNWSSRKLHGPGRLLTIMAAPRQWERGAGSVPLLEPDIGDLLDVRRGQLTIDDYREHTEGDILRRLERGALSPGVLSVSRAADGVGVVVDGDTLCCACSREDAAAGRCHRVWAAPALVRAGWRVILDGVEVQP